MSRPRWFNADRYERECAAWDRQRTLEDPDFIARGADGITARLRVTTFFPLYVGTATIR